MFFGDYFGKYFGYIEGFLTSQVNVRIVKGTYIPCKSCHWYGVCIVPKGRMLGKFKEYFGSNDIHYNNNDGLYAGRSVYTCLEYTTLPK